MMVVEVEEVEEDSSCVMEASSVAENRRGEMTVSGRFGVGVEVRFAVGEAWSGEEKRRIIEVSMIGEMQKL